MSEENKFKRSILTEKIKLCESEIQILIAWHSAHKQAKNNSSLLLLSDTFSDLCSIRMQVCSVADSLLYSLSPDEIYPKPLFEHLKSENDRGCMSCWINSGRKEHPECEVKIFEWFRSYKALLEYVEKEFSQDDLL